MRTAFILVSSFFAVISTLPYMRDVYHRKTKPREVSWFIWGLLAAIASAAAFSDHQYSSAILSLWTVIVTWIVVILGIRYGDRTLTVLDVSCIVASGIGLILWWIFNSPGIAILATISIDLVATLPTMIHSWKKPYEETVSAYIMGLLAAIFALLAAKELSITAVAFPLYLTLSDIALVLILLTRVRRISN